MSENSREPAAAGEPADRVSLDDSMYLLLLVVLDSLTPEERVSFILHDVFGVAYRTVADVVGRSPDATRELARSARRQVQQRARSDASPDHHRAIVLQVLHALRERDEGALRHLLHDHVVAVVDGGGQVDVTPSPVGGAAKVARLLLALTGSATAVTLSHEQVNGRLGVVARRKSRVVGVASARVTGDAIRDIWIVVNPEKLRGWNDA